MEVLGQVGLGVCVLMSLVSLVWARKLHECHKVQQTYQVSVVLILVICGLELWLSPSTASFQTLTQCITMSGYMVFSWGRLK